jgi:hypothetical protein
VSSTVLLGIGAGSAMGTATESTDTAWPNNVVNVFSRGMLATYLREAAKRGK